MNTKQNKKRKVNSKPMGLLNLSCDLDKSTYDSLIALQQERNIPMDALIESAIKSYVNGFIKPKVK